MLDGIELERTKVKRKDEITTIDTITHGIIVHDKQITINSKVLFTRLTGMHYIPVFIFYLFQFHPQKLYCQLICFYCQDFLIQHVLCKLP